jgi:hypothetical protein
VAMKSKDKVVTEGKINEKFMEFTHLRDKVSEYKKDEYKLQH